MIMNIPPPKSEERKLKDRIRVFYDHFNNRDWKACFATIDPVIRNKKLDETVYEETLKSFSSKYVKVTIIDLQVTIYKNIKSYSYGDRDFAYGKLSWMDFHNRSHVLNERWVKEKDGEWYTCMVGLA